MARDRCKIVTSPDVSLSAIIDHLSWSFGLPPGALASRGREQRTAFVRQLAMYLCRRLPGASFPVIARHFGRHRATAIYACRLIERRMARQPAFRRFIEQLEGVIADTIAASRESLPMRFCSNADLDAAVSRLLGPVVLELSVDPAVQEVSANFEAGWMRLFATTARASGTGKAKKTS